MVVALQFQATMAWSEERQWTDSSGSFSAAAELVNIEDGNVVLREADGREISVPIERLSKTDQAFLDRQRRGRTESAGDAIAEIAMRFYSELRSDQRDAAREALTGKAQDLMKGAKSPLAGLPSPEEGRRAIRIGRAKFDGRVAEVPVQVRAGGEMHQTRLHLREEGNQWRVFAISAVYPDGERSINFEAPIAPQKGADVDPLATLIGKPFQLSGISITGERIDIAQLKGKVVLVDFWATWCGPCRKEIPNILANYQKHRNDGFEVIAVSVDEDLDALKAFVTAEQPPWPVVVDNFPGNRQSMAGRYQIRAIPSLVLVGRDGKVATVHCRGERLGQALAQLIGPGRGRVSDASSGAMRHLAFAN